MIPALTALSSLGAGILAAPQQATTAASAAGSFENALSQAVTGAVDKVKSGEAAAIQGVEGAVAPMQVVESVMDAQRSLQSVLAIRDKLVSAWQDVSRMSI